ncbi:hypothetical protein [Streptomyces griseosporeus]|uniref:hypothetical protein n=1 Tax=Streptomyces griseosporeus TaxID=1910 RepID=UPI00369C55EB
MRGLPVRRIASTALCAALALALAAPAAVAADGADQRTRAASRTPVPGADALLAQAGGLGALGTVLTPVTRLLDSVLKADDGQLSADQASRLTDAVEQVLGRLTGTAPQTPATTPATTLPAPAATTLPAPVPSTLPAPAASTLPAPATSTLPALPAAPGRAVGTPGQRAAATPADDLRADALAALRKAVDALAKATASGDATKVAPAASGVVTGLVDLTAAVLVAGGLPAPDLAGLAALPDVPAS